MAHAELPESPGDPVKAAQTSETQRTVRGTPEFASGYCPRCSARLESRACQMICRRCGYYMSCSDYD